MTVSFETTVSAAWTVTGVQWARVVLVVRMWIVGAFSFRAGVRSMRIGGRHEGKSDAERASAGTPVCWPVASDISPRSVSGSSRSAGNARTRRRRGRKVGVKRIGRLSRGRRETAETRWRARASLRSWCSTPGSRGLVGLDRHSGAFRADQHAARVRGRRRRDRHGDAARGHSSGGDRGDRSAPGQQECRSPLHGIERQVGTRPV